MNLSIREKVDKFGPDIVNNYFPGKIFAEEAEHGWNSPAMIARKVIEKFDKLESYKAQFYIETKVGKKIKKMSGTCLYKKVGKMRFDFSSPYGDKIISDGKTLWIYIKKLNAVGRQSLTLEKKRDNRPIFTEFSGPGLTRLFRKYHYRFDNIQQPRIIGKEKFFILDLKQKVKIGGFAKIKLFIAQNSYLIKKAVAVNDFGLTSTISFKNIRTNINIQDGKFRFNIPGNAKIVQNPLVNE